MIVKNVSFIVEIKGSQSSAVNHVIRETLCYTPVTLGSIPELLPMIPIPKSFVQKTIKMYGESGRAWIESLPNLLEYYAQHWSLILHPPFELSYNYVAPAIRADGREAVLKLGFPNQELLSEMHALQHFDGRGIVQILEADFEHQVFLLERVRPGIELITIENDDEVIRIAAEVMGKYWQPVTGERPLLTVENWTAGLTKLRPHF